MRIILSCESCRAKILQKNRFPSNPPMKLDMSVLDKPVNICRQHKSCTIASVFSPGPSGETDRCCHPYPPPPLEPSFLPSERLLGWSRVQTWGLDKPEAMAKIVSKAEQAKCSLSHCPNHNPKSRQNCCDCRLCNKRNRAN